MWRLMWQWAHRRCLHDHPRLPRRIQSAAFQLKWLITAKRWSLEGQLSLPSQQVILKMTPLHWATNHYHSFAKAFQDWLALRMNSHHPSLHSSYRSSTVVWEFAYFVNVAGQLRVTRGSAWGALGSFRDAGVLLPWMLDWCWCPCRYQMEHYRRWMQQVLNYDCFWGSQSLTRLNMSYWALVWLRMALAEMRLNSEASHWSTCFRASIQLSILKVYHQLIRLSEL